MQVVEAVLIEDCLAPKRMGEQSVGKKPFRRGTRIRGVVTDIALTPDSQVLALKTKDGYLIPEPFLNVLGAVEDDAFSSRSAHDDIQDAEIVEEREYTTDKTKSVMDVYNSIKASDIVSRNSKKSKHAVNFALIGGGLGLVFALLRGKSKWIYMAGGVIAGGMVGNYYGHKIIKNNETAK